MSRDVLYPHGQLASGLRSRAAETGILDRQLRRGVLARGGGGPAVPAPYDRLAAQVGGDSFRVTDAQVQAVLRETGSEKATFEVILAAAIGAGLRRWDAAERAIREAGGASA